MEILCSDIYIILSKSSSFLQTFCTTNDINIYQFVEKRNSKLMEYLQNKNIFSSSLKTETENWIIVIWTYKAITEKII